MSSNKSDNIRGKSISELKFIEESFRDSVRLVVNDSAKYKVDFLKDYVYISITALGILIALLSSDTSSRYIQSYEFLVLGASFLSVTTVYALIARVKLLDDFESFSIFNENQFMNKYYVIEKISMTVDRKEMEILFNHLDDLRDAKAPHQSAWVASAHERLLWVFVPGIIMIAVSMTAKTILELLT